MSIEICSICYFYVGKLLLKPPVIQMFLTTLSLLQLSVLIDLLHVYCGTAFPVKKSVSVQWRGSTHLLYIRLWLHCSIGGIVPQTKLHTKPTPDRVSTGWGLSHADRGGYGPHLLLLLTSMQIKTYWLSLFSVGTGYWQLFYSHKFLEDAWGDSAFSSSSCFSAGWVSQRQTVCVRGCVSRHEEDNKSCPTYVQDSLFGSGLAGMPVFPVLQLLISALVFPKDNHDNSLQWRQIKPIKKKETSLYSEASCHLPSLTCTMLSRCSSEPPAAHRSPALPSGPWDAVGPLARDLPLGWRRDDMKPAADSVRE